MDELSKILCEATAAIEPAYFMLNIAGGIPVYRERVYCYELYHQMRLRWPEGSPYYLNGEVDKIAHPLLSEMGIATKPDLLVHRPGDMRRNHAVIEVKPTLAGRREILKDLETLSAFANRAGYQRAILLFYGGNTLKHQVGRTIRALAPRMSEAAPIEIWLHPEVGQGATHVSTLENFAIAPVSTPRP